jgi:hypothetical protein
MWCCDGTPQLWVPSTSDDVAGFITDIKLAQSAGIDGFAINTADWSAVGWAIPRYCAHRPRCPRPVSPSTVGHA